MAKRKLIIATRKSSLALWQAHHVREKLLAYWPELTIELLPMSTSGDNFTRDKLASLGGKSLFVKELEDALLDHRADLAVHSMKDVTAELPQGLSLSAICTRHNPYDALISQNNVTLSELPNGSLIGTSSLRRQSQLLAIRPDLTVKFLRGNIHTRLRKFHENQYDAIILAAAGLERMEMHSLISETLDSYDFLPACGQGALGIECCSDDVDLRQFIAPLNDPVSSLCVRTERQVNEQLGGNCHVPIAIFCQIYDENQILLQAKVCNENGTIIISEKICGLKEKATEMANLCVQRLIEKGADKLLNLKNQ